MISTSSNRRRPDYARRRRLLAVLGPVGTVLLISAAAFSSWNWGNPGIALGVVLNLLAVCVLIITAMHVEGDRS